MPPARPSLRDAPPVAIASAAQGAARGVTHGTARGLRRVRALWVLGALGLSLGLARETAAQTVRVRTDAAGARLEVDGRDVLIRGMNWDYIPIGQNYTYSLWTQPDAVIKAALDREMTLLKAMGVNAIRQYVGIPPRWVAYIYQQYGIFTVLNHPLGRYGTTIDGVYSASTNYADPRARATLLAEVAALVDSFKGTPGVLMYLLGNENNYGLTWKSAATEALPVGERDAAKARYLYSLFNEAIGVIKARDAARPVAMANGDLQYIDILAQEVHGLDIFGSNVYRGRSFRDLFQTVHDKLGLPVMFTEFGADAFHAQQMREDQAMQARYLLAQWQEIYEQSHGKGGVGNAIGGFTFQWSDGWWKTGQESLLDVHNTDAAWAADAYTDDYRRGTNNMNEEWWGITAKGMPDAKGLFPLYPRAAYYALQRVYQLDAMAPTTTRAVIAAHFAGIDPEALTHQATIARIMAGGPRDRWLQLGTQRITLATYTTGGARLATPTRALDIPAGYPSARGTDHLESFFSTIESHPSAALSASLTLNAVGHVPTNPIDEIFYENHARAPLGRGVDGAPGTVPLGDHLRVYRGSVRWEHPLFTLDGFYRTGHYHWGYEGDFFGLYREANYGPNVDTYNGVSPVGIEWSGKQALDGVKLAIGPSLWWGANPAVLAKVRRTVGPFDVAVVLHDDLARASASSRSSVAIPIPPTRNASLDIVTRPGPFTLEVGGLWGGDTKVGQRYQLMAGTAASPKVVQDRIRTTDTFGAKAKLSLSVGRWNWYLQGASMGLVADGGPTSTQTFTGWGLKDSGSGNQNNLLTGFTVGFGDFQIAPNVLWQRPIVAPMPITAPAPGRPRNLLDDPFAVRANREMLGAELLLTYDPTPATWMYQWDNDVREDARFAANLGAVFRHQPTVRDANIGILADGRTTFAFPGSPPPRDLWEVRSRMVSRVARNLRVIANGFVGVAESNGSDARLIRRYGGDLRLVAGQVKLVGAARFNDWGPYDYHRDFNLTYPMQLTADLGYVLGLPQWFDVPETRFGVRGSWRTLDRMSPRFCPAIVPNSSGVLACDATAPGPDGREWELRAYVMMGW